MKHLVIYAHPNPQGLNGHLKQVVLKHLTKNGHQTIFKKSKMKKTILFLVLSILFFNPTFAQKYFGKSYPATQNVDEYYDIADVKKAHTVMGKAELSLSFRSLEKSQRKIIELAKSKGADGVIFSIVEEVYGTSNSSNGSLSDKKKNKTTVSSNSTSTDLKKKTIKATFVKYD